MKKYIIAICVVTILIISYFIYSNYNTIGDWFWNKVSIQLTKELEENHATQYGVRGKDTVLAFGDGKFQIGHYSSGNNLEMYYNQNTSDILLKNIISYKQKSGMLFILSEEGYAVINGDDNTCRLFITVPEDEFYNGYVIDEKNQKHYNSRFITDEHIEYLVSYDNYTKEEKKIFEEMR